MGQEILYCNKCGKRLVGDDFTRGRAHTFNNRQYCSTCVPQSVSSQALAAAPKESRASERSAVSQSRLKAAKPATARAATAPPKSDSILYLGLGLGAILTAVLGVFLVTRPSEPLPEPVAAKPPPPPVAKPGPSKPPPPVTPAVAKEKIAQELKELETRIAPTLQNEQFAAAADLLEEARKRYPTADWDQAVAKMIGDVRERATKLYGPLKEQAANAQLRSGLEEAKQLRSRVALWGRKDLLDDLDRALAGIVPREPLPPGATVLAQFPNGDLSRYYYAGEQKNGVLVGVDMFDGKSVGIEKGQEIFKVPSEGEVRVTYSTTTAKPVQIVARAFAPDGKNYPFFYVEADHAVGRPQVLKVPLLRLKSWTEKFVTPGLVVDNLYFRTDDKSAVLTVYEIVVFKTRD